MTWQFILILGASLGFLAGMMLSMLVMENTWQLGRLWGVKYVHAKNVVTDIIRPIKRTANGERFIRYFGHNLVYIDRPNCGWTVTELDTPTPAKRITIHDDGAKA